ncbi:MAG: mechanosensitive ion channel family protein, partial [Bacteroidales bacterium]|nr:mechanosensitive ion channel family protein [Bacteroidales bacterium]
MVVMPLAAILSSPWSIKLALDVFDLSEIYNTIFNTMFFNLKDASGNEIVRLSFRMIIIATSLFFVFRFVNYLLRSLYRELKIGQLIRTSGKAHIHTNEVNLTLANNVISILVWGVYIIITFILIKIPTGALSIIAAGLATGVGLAMKDILNNFIYGIQLMSGRLRVGDWVECDGVRGKVSEINYQSTQLETVDGAVMSFLNTALFNKNFKNLTRNNAYEFVKISVGVSYGTDVEKVRVHLLEALKALQKKDKYDRDIVDLSRGVSVTFDEFGGSSVDLAVKQFVLVSEKVGYIARAKEVIYNTLNENGIEIPFPQVDVHMKEN